MSEIVSSFQCVTDIMAEISAATAEQSAGIAQVSEAVSQMDQVTQQNAALVEESYAASESLKLQSQALVGTVSLFKLANDQAVAPTRAPVAAVLVWTGEERRSPNRAKNVARPQFGAKTPMPVERTGTDDWETF